MPINRLHLLFGPSKKPQLVSVAVGPVSLGLSLQCRPFQKHLLMEYKRSTRIVRASRENVRLITASYWLAETRAVASAPRPTNQQMRECFD